MKRIDRSTLLLAVASAAFLAAASHSLAQQPAAPAPVAWHIKNAKVLPADISQQQLRATMKGFALGLGVRCSHCHVGVEGQPLSTFDFASDAKPEKDIARAMMRMVHRLNDEELPAIKGLEAPQVTCFTCHRGSVKPLTVAPEPPPTAS